MSYCNKSCRLEIATALVRVKDAIERLSFEGNIDAVMEKYAYRIYGHVKNAVSELHKAAYMMEDKLKSKSSEMIKEMIDDLEKKMLIAPYDEKPGIQLRIMKLRKKLKENW